VFLPADCAFVTFLMLNDAFLPGALLQGYELMKQAPGIARVCLVTDGVSARARSGLQRIFDHVIPVDTIFAPHRRRHARQDRPFLLTRLQALRLGPDGDLDLGFRKIVLLDADILPLKRFAQLFLVDTPAGILNERKSHFVTINGDGRHVRPKDVDINGRWVWHEIYQRIGHGARIPRHITDRVHTDPGNLGVNTALMVLRPSQREYLAILADLQRPGIIKLLTETFDWPDMQYLTMRWSGRWVNLDLSFCGISGYPSLAALCGTHFAGFKPWCTKQVSAFSRYSRFPDFVYWHERFLELMDDYPELHRLPRLADLAERIRALPAKLHAAAGDGTHGRVQTVHSLRRAGGARRRTHARN
jgi:glycogenin glucosyltransferase